MEDFLKPDYLKKMSKRDLARANFVKNFRKKQAIKKSVKNTLTVEMEKMKDFEEGIAGMKQMNYNELVDEINKDRKALEEIDKPLTLYKNKQELEV